MKKKSLPANMRGFAIILVLATLVLLAMLSLTYIKLALIDRNIARNYMDNKRARLIAQSGVEYAIARIQENILDTSWQAGKTIKINGTDTKYTESSGSTYGEKRDIFKVEVKDSNSMINVNDGLGNDRVTANTKRILNVLGDVVGVVNLGNKLLDDNRRPPQGYTSKQELLKYLTQDEFNTIKNLVTIHAWQDPNVANPVPLSKAVISAYGDPYANYDTQIGVYRYGRGKDSDGNVIGTIGGVDYSQLRFADESSTFAAPGGFQHAIYGLDELNPQWIEIVSRSPVNINQADERVLIALIKDLQGFFCSDRRRNAPRANNVYSIRDDFPGFNYAPGGYQLTSHPFSHNFEAGIMDGDEIGFLYSTEAISNAQQIASEIKKCRDNDASYAGKWYRGPFKTWRQFNAFVDDHVHVNDADPKIIKDSRTTIFYKYYINPNVFSNVYHTLELDSKFALNIAHQAKGDVLKANFNPNLHLNELNPDANIKLLVDKTDLIVNSTEFCFTPMGYFQIESEGFILRPNDTDNAIIANSKIESVVKLYDAYRETNQSQFLKGKITSNGVEINLMTQEGTLESTNNKLTLEVGPEPSATLAQRAILKENEYSGYISLPTVSLTNIPQGSATVSETITPGQTTTNSETTTSSSTTTDPPTTNTTVTNNLPKQNWTTKVTKTTTNSTTFTDTTTTTMTFTQLENTVDLTITSTLGSRLYGSLKENYSLDFHGSGSTANLPNYNAADPTEPTKTGPYIYGDTTGDEVSKHTLCKSYRSNAGSKYAPADLRIDGAYLERHSGLAYSVTSKEFLDVGAACYWVKPSFYPEQAGKPRSYLNISKSLDPTQFLTSTYILFFANCYFPSSGGAENGDSLYYMSSGKPFWVQNSLMFSFSDAYDKLEQFAPYSGYGQTTPCLNHTYHSDSNRTYLKSGQWIHVICAWDFINDYEYSVDAGSGSTDPTTICPIDPAVIYVNGAWLNKTLRYATHPSSFHILPAYGRLAHTQKLHVGPAGLLSNLEEKDRNWSADSTIDEFYIFSALGTTQISIKPKKTVATTTATNITVTYKTTVTTTTEVYDDKGNLYSSETTTTESSTTEPFLNQTTNESVTGRAPIKATTTCNLQEVIDLAKSIYTKSRYYMPNSSESYYISGELRDLFLSKRSPETSIIEPPVGSTGSIAELSQPTKIIGISWTYYGEEVDGNGNPVIKNYKTCESPDNLPVEIDISIQKYDPVSDTLLAEYGPFDQDGFSATSVEQDPAAEYRYKVTFKVNTSDPLNTVLLYTPIFDDITIYYTNGVKFLSYSYWD